MISMVCFFKMRSTKSALLALLLSIFLPTAIFSTPTLTQDKSFAIVVASYNNKNWYQKNLDSIFSQNYPNYRLIYVDDASEDGTATLVREYVIKKGQEDRTTIISNDTRLFAMANFYKAIWLCSPEEIVVELDGDDWFANENVLAYLNEVYADPEVWVTYGQFQFYPCGSPGWSSQLPFHVIENNAYREHNWITTHLRTYYACLFHQIEKQDFYLDGTFVETAGDLARLFPILEMAGWHSRFIPYVLYIYNIATGINDHIIQPIPQRLTGYKIREKKKYQPLEKLPYTRSS